MSAVWPWPVGPAKSPLDLGRQLQTDRLAVVGEGHPSPETREWIKKIMPTLRSSTLAEKFAIKLPLREGDEHFDAEDRTSTADLLGFAVSDFYYRRSEDDPEKDESKQAMEAGWFINDVAEGGESSDAPVQP